ncbi:SRPBCC family protein [candidate division CSSED10-310 bacterium]|uniref:SRPBCC family protein n=1 Tax=candidate division CSSED10-310 bacterium TaxID=2855610 RepID=A0ABV6Z649_UNCC1
MRNPSFLISLFLIICCGTPLFASDLSPGDASWIKSGDKGEFKTYYRDVKGSGTREVLMVGIIDAPPARCFKVVGDYEAFPKFMPYIQFTKVINSEKKEENKTINYVFFFLSPPMVSYRYYSLRLVDEKQVDGKPNTFRSKWTLVTKGPYRKTPTDADIKKHLKSSWQEPIETSFNEGSWLFEPLENGQKTRVKYYVWTNPGGSIPNWIANKANSVALPALWKALKKRLKHTKYDPQKVPETSSPK